MTVCSTSNIREKHEGIKISTGCCWNKFSEKSLESSDSEQRVKGGQVDPGTTRKTTGRGCGEQFTRNLDDIQIGPVSFVAQVLFVSTHFLMVTVVLRGDTRSETSA